MITRYDILWYTKALVSWKMTNNGCWGQLLNLVNAQFCMRKIMFAELNLVFSILKFLREM